MNKQLTFTVNQMKNLKNLGLDTSDASMTFQEGSLSENGTITTEYHILPFKYSECINKIGDEDVLTPAYTLQDVLSIILPINVTDKSDPYTKYTSFLKKDAIGIIKDWWNGTRQNNKSLIECPFSLDGCYDVLVWCLQNNFINK